MPTRGQRVAQQGFVLAVCGVALLAGSRTGHRVLAGPSGESAQTRASTQAQQTYLIPHVVSAGNGGGSVLGYGQGQVSLPHGMVGFGESTLEIQNRTENDVTVEAVLESMVGFDNAYATRSIDAMAVDKILLSDTPGVTFSDYSAKVTSDGEIGIVARTTWEGGAMAAYEAPEPSNSLVLPLFAVDVYSHTTMLQLSNSDANFANDVIMELFDHNGRLVREFRFGLDAGESGRVDPYYLIDFHGLPVVAGGGYLGSARFTADLPVAIMAYGDEAEGRGATAVTARPTSKAGVVQHLPLIRANMGGDSLIAVSNVGDDSVDITIEYLGAPDSPSGASERFVQTFSIGGRYHAIIDLDPTRQRGNVNPPDLPRGYADGRGFLGSATISASAPVMASVLEQELIYEDNGLQQVLTSAAYNGFGSADLARTLVVPRARVGLDGYTSQLVIQNPSDEIVEVVVDWVASGPHGAEREWSGPHDVPPGQVVIVEPTLEQSGLPAQAIVKASAPVAVLVYDVGSNADVAAYRAVVVPDDVTDLPEPPAATATYTPSPTFTPSPTPTWRWPRRTPDATWTPVGPPTAARSATPTSPPTVPPTYTPSPTTRVVTPTAETATPSATSSVFLPRCLRP
jgi:hypothetical protein